MRVYGMKFISVIISVSSKWTYNLLPIHERYVDAGYYNYMHTENNSNRYGVRLITL